ncbi:transcription initiation factor [Nesidiocoris tenuis]|uniref:Transcription initiation factor n=1 Tax=Nesidiocoris tenuis TaxID=355587 RepID=A0ABN7B3M4_9HEMI|nr:transcription initiation factor [Nesidiocoris tenuis]
MSMIGGARSSLGAPSSKAVRFQLDFNLKANLLKHANREDCQYNELVQKIKDHGQDIRDDDLAQLLKEARGCISLLDDNFRLFVQVVLILEWTHRSPDVISEYQGFLLDLCAAHNYYTKHVIDQFIASFRRGGPGEWKDGLPSEEGVNCFSHIHDTIRQLLKVVPMSKDILISAIKSSVPFYKRPPKDHESFVYNALQISKYLPSERYGLLKVIISHLTTLDVNSPRSSLEQRETPCSMDVDSVFPMDDIIHPVAFNLDVALNVLFIYCKDEVIVADKVNMDKLKSLYHDLVKVFEDVVLPTHATQHVQFLIFYLLGLKPSLAPHFIGHLWNKATDPNIPPIIRQSAVCYVASLIARANYISITTTKATITEISTWIHRYINSQDEGSANTPYVDTRVHGVFYMTCQALFYIIGFRYKELVNNQGLTMLNSINLQKIVTCRLNPLRVCSPVVASNFASIARAYQLAYCYTIMERNQRNNLPIVNREAGSSVSTLMSIQLDSFFPFDPYLLVRTKKYVETYYREYTEPNNDEHGKKTSNEDEDDFLEDVTGTSAPTNFSYSSSPGFLHIQ